ncbi:MAG: hypothetical protein COW69_01660 [Candidatus Huberarchaeum crystalense]|uniref:Uncharacterized protein n=1 Tax=Huberarchaeum crystalense TaxID=2014257 RepID=A0A2G9LJ23_HUBC1|nr:MAG: hypothetical protein AUJ91_01170 [archaeon CG2_30_31_98]PIN66546.1 MAG: hypothetical protein COW69_01660 [Candidatus Huberarchaeum crystalense]PJC01055.1 MAG: hypothetical protein CO072_02470 [Candidatus Huberarchaeum crystalense]
MLCFLLKNFHKIIFIVLKKRAVKEFYNVIVYFSFFDYFLSSMKSNHFNAFNVFYKSGIYIMI